MEEDEILDSPELINRHKKIWKPFLLSIFTLAVFTFFIRQVFTNSFLYNFNGLVIFSILPYPYLSFIFIILIHFLFIKKINYKSESIFKIILLSATILFGGLIIGVWFDLIKIHFFNNDLIDFQLFLDAIPLQLILSCIIISSMFSTGSYHWLKNKNRWLLPLLILLFFGLAFMDDYLNQVNPNIYE